MTALSDDKQAISALGNWSEMQVEIIGKTGVQFYQGGAVGRDPSDSGLLKKLAAGKPYYRTYGRTRHRVLADGVKRPVVEAGLFEFENSTSGDAILATLPLGWPLYAADDQTAALTWGSGTRAFLGQFGGMSSNGKPLVWVGLPLTARPLVWPITFGYADVVAAGGAALTADLTFGPPLPGPCRVIGFSTDELTVFSGGSVATCTFKLGTSAGGTEIHTALDIFTGATAAPKKGTAGTLGYDGAPLAAGTQIQGRVTTTTANVNALTAGAYVGSLILQPGS